jgi:hypothetical protein
MKRLILPCARCLRAAPRLEFIPFDADSGLLLPGTNDTADSHELQRACAMKACWPVHGNFDHFSEW